MFSIRPLNMITSPEPAICFYIIHHARATPSIVFLLLMTAACLRAKMWSLIRLLKLLTCAQRVQVEVKPTYMTAEANGFYY